ncbi:hypothetical protein HK104_001739 [Borealophlyctis nickersoniae]|nr:hypothetical protein HK104_001739 [Borealophlyctis nickersoniae]
MRQQHPGERYRDGASRDVHMEIQEIQRLKDNPDHWSLRTPRKRSLPQHHRPLPPLSVTADASEIFGAVCLIPGGHRCVLEGMDALCDAAGMWIRFEVVVYALWQSCQGMTPLEKDLQVTSMSVHQRRYLCGGPGVNLEFRMHLRYEFLQLGLMQLVDKIGFFENQLLQTQIDIWIAGLEADEEEPFQKVDIEFMNLDDFG